MELTPFAILFFVNFRIVSSSFLSGTLSWETRDAQSSTKVTLHGRYGFIFGKGPGCGKNVLPGNPAINFTNSNGLACTSGCTPNPQNIAHGDLNYNCGSFQDPEWEQGDEFLEHDFPSTSRFTVSYTGAPWIQHDHGNLGHVHFQTTIDFGSRNDTNKPNSSPVTSSLPVYKIPFDCTTAIKIPVYDQDDDVVSCRWAAGVECGGVCNGLPRYNLDTQRCILTIQPNLVTGFIDNGTYIVTLTVEDFPKTDISMGGVAHSPDDPLSQVPLQFIVQTEPTSGGCSDIPTISTQTPKNGQVFIVPSGESFKQKVYAVPHGAATSIKTFVTSVPYRMKNSNVTKESGTVWSTEFTWTPKAEQYSTNIVCFQAMDNTWLYSEQHCFTLLTGVENPCNNHPCEHNGTCSVELDSYKCDCTSPFEGRNCEIDINDCLSSPCKNGGTCWDQVGDYKCFCPVGFMGNECDAIDHCAINPCLNYGSCTPTSSGYNCTCSQGYTGAICETDLDECSSSPCENGGTCTDMVGDFFCDCPIEYQGKNCSIARDFCKPNPCANNGVCTNYDDSYRCSCPSGYIGLDCEIYQPESCAADDDNHCMCLLNGRRVKLPFPQQKDDGFTTDDLVAGIVGLPMGIAMGAVLCTLFHKCIRPKCFGGDTGGRRSPSKRPSSTSSTSSLISRSSTASPSDIRPSVTTPTSGYSPHPVNHYRANLSTDWT